MFENSLQKMPSLWAAPFQPVEAPDKWFPVIRLGLHGTTGTLAELTWRRPGIPTSPLDTPRGPDSSLSRQRSGGAGQSGPILSVYLTILFF